ncbi:hypothetical protein PIIN_05609 [Serendipita indica DSM 11827]|uniref:Uncharacterized protein n=1 Tax=Serendipita indica (strain DSM 11827) TaxID=1109443 RepID=G4TK31_SERID|nr:hypothetical protein PIIN_05609 [Serendipita indica DSM 11827]
MQPANAATAAGSNIQAPNTVKTSEATQLPAATTSSTLAVELTEPVWEGQSKVFTGFTRSIWPTE